MLGGPGAMQDADNEIKEIAKGMKEHAEKALGETYTEFEAVKYTKQIVNGTNYNIKVKVGGEVCTQRGKKLYEGDVFSFEGEDYVVVHS